MLDALNRRVQRIRHLAFQQHANAERHDLRKAREMKADHLERHDGFIQPTEAGDELFEAQYVTRAAGLREPRFDGGSAQSNDRLHGLHVLGAHLNTEVASRAVPDAGGPFKHREPRRFRRAAFTRIGDKAIGLCQRRGAEKPLVGLVRCAGRHACTAHDAGVHIVKLIGVGHHRESVIARTVPAKPRCDRPGLAPEPSHVHGQVLQDGQVPERCDVDLAMALPFLPDRRPAGELLRAVDGHRA